MRSSKIITNYNFSDITLKNDDNLVYVLKCLEKNTIITDFYMLNTQYYVSKNNYCFSIILYLLDLFLNNKTLTTLYIFDGKIKRNLVGDTLEDLLLTKIKYNNTVIDLGIK